MNTRKIEVIIAPPKAHYVGDGFRVHNFIPGAYSQHNERMDPFILLDYNSKFYKIERKTHPSQTWVGYKRLNLLLRSANP